PRLRAAGRLFPRSEWSSADSRNARGAPMRNRVLQKSRGRSRNEARELLQFFFASELVSPSKTLWLVSPWLRDIELFDSAAGAFADLFPDAPKRVIRLTDVLRSLLLS